MSGKKGGVQKLFGDLITTAPVPYIYCSSHNVNLVINDAIEANVTAITFFGTLSQIFNFFLIQFETVVRAGFLITARNGIKVEKTLTNKVIFSSRCSP